MPAASITTAVIPARYFATLCDVLDAAGVDSRGVVLQAGLDRAMLNEANRGLSAAQLEAIVSHAQQFYGRSDLAFELGRRVKINSHDILSGALLGCSSLDHLLSVYARYRRLINPLLAMTYQRDGDSAELMMRPALPMPPHVLRFALETTAVSMLLQIKSVIQGRPGRIEVFISMPPPPHEARFAELGAKFHFEASPLPGIRIKLIDAGLDLPMPMANPQAVQLAENRCKLMLREVDAKGSWSDWVSMMLQHAEDCQPMLEDLAKLLNVTSRTLDRYLSKEGTSFRELSVRIRNQRACKLLNDGKMTISQIAYTLGYTDLANFSRSFKKVCGVSPSVYKGGVTQAA